MKLLFNWLDALLTELRDRKVDVVRILPTIELDTSPRTDGVTHVVACVLVTAALDDHQWAEWRHWVGRAVAEADRGGGVQLPVSLRDRRDRALADVSKRVDDAGFQIREGIVTHDTGVMDCFAPAGAEPALGAREHVAAELPRNRVAAGLCGVPHAIEREQDEAARGRRVGLVLLAALVASLIAGITGALAAVRLGWIPRP